MDPSLIWRDLADGLPVDNPGGGAGLDCSSLPVSVSIGGGGLIDEEGVPDSRGVFHAGLVFEYALGSLAIEKELGFGLSDKDPVVRNGSG